MNPYFLKIEGQNFASFLDDTQDLSTIRGGSLLLLDVPKRLVREDEATEWTTPKVQALEAVSLGASAGLFSFEAPNDDAASELKRHIEHRLRHDEVLRHGTFAVEVVRAGASLAPPAPAAATVETSFQDDQEALSAKIRWHQMTAPSLAFPTPVDAAQPCALDRLRPARQRASAKGVLSESVYRRREFGRAQKQAFYRAETGLELKVDFSESFENLTHAPEQGLLDGKMAVFYVDGNHLGRRLRREGNRPEALEGLDDELRRRRRRVLRQLVSEAEDSVLLREGRGGGPIRLETLLWGGDEILWVVPAWAGLWLVDLFFQHPWSLAEQPIYHACGLVFCRHKVPIHQTRELAMQLAELAKTKSRREDLVAYQVLESFDGIGDDLTAYRRSRCPGDIDPQALILPPEDLRRAGQAFLSLHGDLPARPVQRGARKLASEGSQAVHRELVDGLRAQLPEEQTASLDRLVEALGPPGQEAAAWLHLSDLWPYLETYVPAGPEADHA